MKRNSQYLSVVAVFVVIALIIGGALLAKKYYTDLYKHQDGFSSDYILTAYTVEWCPHCTTFKPELDKLGATQKINGKTVKIVKVDPEKEPSKKNSEVKGFPTVILGKPDGTTQEYPGGRTADAIVSFLKSVVN
jgi:thiol-disulfide isomerase/thioredoxin